MVDLGHHLLGQIQGVGILEPLPLRVPEDERSVDLDELIPRLPILRVADALDHSHQQRIRQFEFERNQDAYILWVPHDAGDVALERESIREKGNMFNEIFGASIVLKQQRRKAS